MIRTPLKTVAPTKRVTINGHTCEVVRHARRTTYVRIVESPDHDLIGAVVQLPREQKVKV